MFSSVEGECVCRFDAVNMNGHCVHVSTIVKSGILPCLAVALLIGYFIHQVLC